jgi:hypothetical protein
MAAKREREADEQTLRAEDVAALPRIHKGMQLQALKDELMARATKVENSSSLTKAKALKLLGVGSVQLSATKAYKESCEIQKLMMREKMEARTETVESHEKGSKKSRDVPNTSEIQKLMTPVKKEARTETIESHKKASKKSQGPQTTWFHH